MGQYDFSTLNSTDLEELVCDLLNAKEASQNSAIKFRTFKEGKDRGIDLLYSTNDDRYSIVGQVKHYYKSGATRLVRDLEIEKTKVNLLKPDRYIFATSVDLSADQIEDIYNMFSPHIKSRDDIYTKKELNSLIDRFPFVLDWHFKVWFSSAEILRKLDTYLSLKYSEVFIENRIKSRLRLYVETEQLRKAREVLTDNNIVIITGEPGVGKTTHAEMLLYELVKDGYRAHVIDGDIKAFRKLLNDSNDKQVFYFDDFLGHTQKEIHKAQATESSLLGIMQSIDWSKNKKLILTTRTYILNSAIDNSEKLRRLYLKGNELSVSLDNYPEEYRNRLIYNHIDESDLPDGYKAVLRNESILQFLINHKNFYPRSIEYITSYRNIKCDSPGQFSDFIKQNFNKPDEIWRHAYENQIEDIDRMLLSTLLSFGTPIDIKHLEQAFNKRIDYEVAESGFQRPVNAFRKSLRRLIGSFLSSRLDFKRESHEISFLNYSLEDFLIMYLKEDSSEVVRIANSARYIVQLTERIYRFEDGLSDKRQVPSAYLTERIIKKPTAFCGTDDYYDFLRIGLLVVCYFDDAWSRELALRVWSNIVDWKDIDPVSYEAYYLREVIAVLGDDEFINVIRVLGAKVAIPLVYGAGSLSDVRDLIKLFRDRYKIDITSLFRNENAHLNWSDLFFTLFDVECSLLTDELPLDEFDHSKVDEIIRTLTDMRDEVRNWGVDADLNLTALDIYTSRFYDSNSPIFDKN